MKTDHLSGLRDYWEDLRNGRIAPYRAELDPRRFEDALERMFILEQLRPGELRIRLAGFTLCEMMGMEVRGMPPEALFADGARDSFRQHLARTLGTPAVVDLDLVTLDAYGRPADVRMLLLPLRSDFGELSRVLGCVALDENRLGTPANFAIRGARTEPIRATAPESEPANPLGGFSEAPASFRLRGAEPPSLMLVENPRAVGGPRRRGHLRVISRD